MPYVAKAVALVGVRGTAIDLGCGAGIEARYLADHEFRVTAVDNSPSAVESTKQCCAGLEVIVRKSSIEAVKLKEKSLDIIVAWNSLPFLEKDSVRRVLRMVEDALADGGIFVFSVLGTDDAWAATHSDMSFMTRTELRSSLTNTLWNPGEGERDSGVKANSVPW